MVAVPVWAALVQRPAELAVEDGLYEDLLDEGLPGPPEWDQSSYMVCRGCRHGDRAAAFWSSRVAVR